jgi:hypothetical protein
MRMTLLSDRGDTHRGAPRATRHAAREGQGAGASCRACEVVHGAPGLRVSPAQCLPAGLERVLEVRDLGVVGPLPAERRGRLRRERRRRVL